MGTDMPQTAATYRFIGGKKVQPATTQASALLARESAAIRSGILPSPDDLREE